MINLGKMFEGTKNAILTKFGPNPAKMLIYTGVLGWFLSSTAQVTAIAVNDKIPKEQKMFLIPQEIGDGAINVLSFFIVTSTIKSFASKLVSTGKLANPKIREFLRMSGVDKSPQAIGHNRFNIEKLSNFLETTTFSNKKGDNIVNHYKNFKNGIDVIGMTVGSILSCNIITPILRNKFAADRQLKMLAQNDKMNHEKLKSPRGISMDTYQKLSAAKYSGYGLKI